MVRQMVPNGQTPRWRPNFSRNSAPCSLKKQVRVTQFPHPHEPPRAFDRFDRGPHGANSYEQS